MNQKAKEILHQAEAVLSGHFVYTSGKHGPDYIQKDKLYTRPRHLDALCVMMAEWVYDNGMMADVVAAPAVGGINIATGVARELNRLTGGDILAVYAEPADDVVYESKGECLATLQLNSLLTRDPSPSISMFNGDKVIVRKKRMEFRRGYHELIRGRRVLAVEDIINTGGSIKQLIDEVQMSSGMVQAVVALCNRGGVTADQLGVHHLHALVDVKMPMHPAEDCPLCHHNVPININAGHGRAFLASKGIQTGQVFRGGHV